MSGGIQIDELGRTGAVASGTSTAVSWIYDKDDTASWTHRGRFTMEDETRNALRKLIPQKRALRDSTTERDEEGVDYQRCKYERDDGSRREMSEKQASSQSSKFSENSFMELFLDINILLSFIMTNKYFQKY
ncbi:uncharacterized protein LOC115226725 [Octopus sinensis]|uniref:Uncharacterized protein LOC115226725 n=1 Tax=Octopus sinensis TaxID=2607531 RepID=A0A6P7TXV6_9MOLL|nr:uncharacterized protein LOC115226725 [Octopus sinensis]